MVIKEEVIQILTSKGYHMGLPYDIYSLIKRYINALSINIKKYTILTNNDLMLEIQAIEEIKDIVEGKVLCKEYDQLNDKLIMYKGNDALCKYSQMIECMINNVLDTLSTLQKQKEVGELLFCTEFFNSSYNWYQKKTSPETKTSKETKKMLHKYNIHSKSDWKEWLLNNHPDKGGNTEDCQNVIYAGRILGY